MSDLPIRVPTALPLFVPASRWGRHVAASQISNVTLGANQATTWVANLVQYNPVALPWDYPVNRVWWMCGSTTTTSNVDFGIYTFDGTRIYNTGSTPEGTANTATYVTPGTPFVLSAGLYYFAWTCDNTTNRAQTHAGAVIGSSLMGLLEETTGGFGLPATMTPVRFTRVWGYNVCGVTRTVSGF